MPVWQIMFWIATFAVSLTYLIYPVCLWIVTRRAAPRAKSDRLPGVSMVISAFNEEAVIREKIENALALDYPPELLEIIVISDESTDETDRIVSRFDSGRVRLFRQIPRQGKSAGLTKFVPEATGEIVVFSDANSIYQPDAIRKLVRNFGDPRVGFVVGHQRYAPQEHASSNSESLYWRYETALKILESRIGSVTCGDGAIYAIRAELFEPLSADDINDFTLPLKIVVRGYIGVFEQEAVCYEHAAETFAGEFRRKVRIINRSLRAVGKVRGCLDPRRVGWFAAKLFVHKVLRWFVPYLLAVMLVSSGILAAGGSAIYTGLFVAQALFYVLAGSYFIQPLRSLRAVYVPYYFCVVNLAAAIGVAGALLGRKVVMWQPERGAETAPAGGALESNAVGT